MAFMSIDSQDVRVNCVRKNRRSQTASKERFVKMKEEEEEEQKCGEYGFCLFCEEYE